MDSREMVKTAVKLLDDKKATDIVVLDVRELTSLGDYFVICSGTSNTQVRSLADELENTLAKMGVEPRRVEGDRASQWTLLDYSDVICHVFYHETRDFYCLERLWGDAPRLDISEFID